MKRLMIAMMSAVILCLPPAAPASAQEKEIVKKTVTLSEDVWIGGVQLKRGVYQVRFDAKNNELTFFSGGKTVATTKATVEMGKDKARATALTFTTSEKGRSLNRLSFEGDRRSIIVGEAALAADKK